MTKIIASSKYWKCENMDNLAPIIEEGTEYLLSDGTRVLIADNNEYPNKPERANEQEKKAFASQEYGTIFKGDNVIIKRGRKMVGERFKINYDEKIFEITVGKKKGYVYAENKARI